MEVGKTFGGVRYVIIIRRGNMERNLTKELLNFLLIEYKIIQKKLKSELLLEAQKI